MDEFEQWLEKVHASGGDRVTLNQLYDEWARDYNQHIWGSGIPIYAVTNGMVGRYIPNYDARILDAGCGTGNLAQVLHQTGYTNLEGLDPSEGMLAVARIKGIYQTMYPLALGRVVDLPADSYDVVVAAGVLTHGHAPSESLEGIVELVKPGGVIIFSLSEIAVEEQGFKEMMSKLERNGQWAQLECPNLFRTYPFSEKEAHLRNWVYVFRKLAL